MPTAREWRQYDRDRADATLIRRAATFLRDDPSRASYAGLSRDEDAYPLAALLEILASVLPDLDSGVRWQTIESCQVLLGETMAYPKRRGTRRR